MSVPRNDTERWEAVADRLEVISADLLNGQVENAAHELYNLSREIRQSLGRDNF